MISRFFTLEAANYRKIPGEDYFGNYEQTESEVGTFMCHRQQSAPEMATFLRLSMTKSFTLWCAVNTDVREGDTIQIVDDFYTVRAIQKNDTGVNEHLEVHVEYGGRTL